MTSGDITTGALLHDCGHESNSYVWRWEYFSGCMNTVCAVCWRVGVNAHYDNERPSDISTNGLAHFTSTLIDENTKLKEENIRLREALQSIRQLIGGVSI